MTPTASLVTTAGLTAALLIGCAFTTASAPEDTRPLVSPEATFAAFQKAWRQGDVDTLLRLYAAGSLDGLVKQVQSQGREAVSEWYRRDSFAWEFQDLRWDREAQRLAYLTTSLSPRANAAPAAGKDREVTFSFAWVRGGWRITSMRTQEAP